MIVEAILLGNKEEATRLVSIDPQSMRQEESHVEKTVFVSPGGIYTTLLAGNFYLIETERRVFLRLPEHRIYFNVVRDDTYKKRCALDYLCLELMELKKVIAVLEGEYEDIKHVCPKCQSFLTTEQSIRRMHLDGDALSARRQKRKLESKIAKIKEELKPTARCPMDVLLEHAYEEILRDAGDRE